MPGKSSVRYLAVLLWVIGLPTVAWPQATKYASHQPMRPLPAASPIQNRPVNVENARFVDAQHGNDANPGTEAAPWKTFAHATSQLSAGDTLYLRQGIYHEHVTVRGRGTADRPITIRSYPGEMAIIDGGLPEFYYEPADAWEPCPAGAAGEFRSTRTYPDLGGDATHTNLLGNFGDSMIPLHGYRFLSDLRSDNESFARFEGEKTSQGSGIYCGPGVFYDVITGRIHARLAHTHMAYLGDDNYRGETDPRKLRLVIAGHAGGSPLTVADSSNVRLQDLMIRGAREATLSLFRCRNITLDSVTAYGGSSAMRVEDMQGLRAIHCAFRGIAAPWTFRGHLKYRAIEARVVSASSWDPTGFDNRDFEFAYCEFTDCVDGVFIGNVNRVRFHHNLLDNLSDDGIFLTAGTAFDGTTPGGDVHIVQNRLSRCLTTFAFGVGHGRQKTVAAGKQTGAGVWIARNVFDFRRPVHYQQPDENSAQVETLGRVAGDHGGPAWEPMFVYHNTCIHLDPPWRNYYGSGLGGHMGGGTSRRVFNNIFYVADGAPGTVLPTPEADFAADGNLHASAAADAAAAFEAGWRRFRNSESFRASQVAYQPGWTARDRFGDAGFHSVPRDWRQPTDLRLNQTSSAVNVGAALPGDWPDPLRDVDAKEPDAGALPLGAEAWRVGVNGRLSVCGGDLPTADAVGYQPLPFENPNVSPADRPCPSAALMTGYPAFDAPLVEFALRRAGAKVELVERRWLDTAEYSQFQVIVIAGDLARAKVEPTRYNEQDLVRVREFLESGGTLLLMRGTAAIFSTDAGREWLAETTGAMSKAVAAPATILKPAHPWIEQLSTETARDWMQAKSNVPLSVSQGTNLIGSTGGTSILYETSIGRGRLVYVGWELARSLPNGRLPSTVEDEAIFESQMQILTNIADAIVAVSDRRP